MPVLCSTQTATGTDTDWNKLGFVVPSNDRQTYGK